MKPCPRCHVPFAITDEIMDGMVDGEWSDKHIIHVTCATPEEAKAADELLQWAYERFRFE